MTCLSLLYQIAFLLNQPLAAFPIEFIGIIYSISYIKKNLKVLLNAIHNTLTHISQNKFRNGIFLSILTYLFFQSILLYPNNIDSLIYHLSRILLFQQNNTFFLNSTHLHHIVVFPVGNDILYHHFLRFHITRGLGFFGFLSYIGIILGTYAFIRENFSAKIASVSAIIVAGLPELVFMSTTPKNDITVCFVGVICLFLLCKLYKSFNPQCFLLSVILLGFGLSAKTTTIAFLIPYLITLTIILFKKPHTHTLLNYLYRHPTTSISCLFSTIILSQSWLYLHNTIFWNGWSGPPTFTIHGSQNDGIIGGIANSLRYGLEMIYIPGEFDIKCHNLFGVKPSQILESIYYNNIDPIFGNSGMAPLRRFYIEWKQNEDHWYGPFSILILGCILWQLITGRGYSRIVSMILITFFSILCLKMGWTENKERFFALFFSAGAFSLAHLLSKLNKRLLFAFSALSILYMAQAATFNITKPLFTYESIRIDNIFRDSILNGNNVWAKTSFGKTNYWENYVDELRTKLPDDGSIALISDQPIRLFPLLIGKPYLVLEGLNYPKGSSDINRSNNPFDKREINLEKYDYLLLMMIEHEVEEDQWIESIRLCEKEVTLDGETLKLQKVWSYAQQDQIKPISLYKIKKQP